MNFKSLIAEWTKYAPAIAAIASGVALVAAKDYGPGITQLLQAGTILFGGVAVVQLHHAVNNPIYPGSGGPK